ncbi:class I SAM-dependent methyltransferase [Roseisolibacter sp. H3M3-2]|uniref:class I SAM-dependent methyltransferase n=1 Tax=Roseisolibacter sp. H3M3-2 TaxID=3031323 RepID=UPI0023D9CF4C|nr:class I SAM-dependent methyltransferase [Roseisolibacter sp. H3M3-2]MDF1502390.1 class I SAM-dependent methyltransferase [Roseisolibacter sp. H3M3-2]
MQTIDHDALNSLLARALVDLGAITSAPLVLIGERLGLFRALAAEALTTAELAARTGTAERYAREWVRAQAAGGYVTYDPAADRYALSPEQAMLFADEGSPAFLLGGFELALAATRMGGRLEDAFRTGAGIGWHEHDHGVFSGCARFFETSYTANLLAAWLPALDGVEARLRTPGARVADVGCGHGASTLLMARAFPDAEFAGFDYHDGSIDAARRRAAAAGLGNVRFETASATTFPGDGYDLIAFFDALHDLGDPVAAASRARAALAPGGTLMIVEPRAGDRVEENLNPVGRQYYAASTLLCTPNALDQGGPALGAQAGEAGIRPVLQEAGFSRIRRAADTPFNTVYEVRI